MKRQLADLQREKNVLRQLVKAREAIKRKYRILKCGKDNAEKTLSETFEVIVHPLEKLVAQKNKATEQSIVEHKTLEQNSIKQNESSDSELDDTIQNVHEASFETAGSDTRDDSDLYVKALKLNQPQYLDKIYGVRNANNKFFIGNLPISFYTNKIKVNGGAYTKTTGILELLIAKQPNEINISSDDLKNYRKILKLSSAHKRQYNKDEKIRIHNSNKFNNIIAPMFNITSKTGELIKGGSLPRHKIAKKRTTLVYVYWDEPNELIDRLYLLTAERSAGNPSHVNEIHSIIEELREAGYIYILSAHEYTIHS